MQPDPNNVITVKQDLWFHHHITTTIALAGLGMLLGTLVGRVLDSTDDLDAETEARVKRMLRNNNGQQRSTKAREATQKANKKAA